MPHLNCCLATRYRWNTDLHTMDVSLWNHRWHFKIICKLEPTVYGFGLRFTDDLLHWWVKVCLILTQNSPSKTLPSLKINFPFYTPKDYILARIYRISITPLNISCLFIFLGVAGGGGDEGVEILFILSKITFWVTHSILHITQTNSVVSI